MSAIATYSMQNITAIDPSTNPVIDLQLSNTKRTNLSIFVLQINPAPDAVFYFYDNSGVQISAPINIKQPSIIMFTNSKVSKFTVTDNISYQIIVAYTIIDYFDESISNQIPQDFAVFPMASPYSIGGKIFSFDVSVGTTAIQISTDTFVRKAIDIFADPSNTDIVFVGTDTAQNFPLRAGANLTLLNAQPNLIYAKAHSGTQTLHIIYSGA